MVAGRACSSSSVTASSEPWTSAFRIRLRLLSSCSAMLEDVLQGGAAGRSSGAPSRPRGGVAPGLRDGAGRHVVGGDTKLVAGQRHHVEPETSTGIEGIASFTSRPWSSNMARTRPKPSPQTNDVADPERPVLDQRPSRPRRGPGSRFDSRHGARRRAVGSAVSSSSRRRARCDSSRSSMPGPSVAAISTTWCRRPTPRGRGPARQLAGRLVEVSASGQVDLVDRDDDRHLGRLGVGDGLDGLGHDAVVGRDDQDDDVGRRSRRGPAWR